MLIEQEKMQNKLSKQYSSLDLFAMLEFSKQLRA